MDEHGRPEPPTRAHEFETLVGFLDYQRATLRWKCSELDSVGLATTVGASTLTLVGLVDRAQAATLESMVDGGLDRPTARRWPDGFQPSLRWVLLHMIEEYARHNGHADLLREAVDGATGE